jgi:hypothetical protein
MSSDPKYKINKGIEEALKKEWDIFAVPHELTQKLEKGKTYIVVGKWDGTSFEWEYKEVRKK